jgi:hypothetical protein
LDIRDLRINNMTLLAIILGINYIIYAIVIANECAKNNDGPGSLTIQLIFGALVIMLIYAVIANI